MNEKACQLKLCVDNIIKDFSFKEFKSDFNKRLLLQKNIYLLQSFGVDLGYSYNWYLRGPYCSDLASDAFEIAEDEKAYGEYCAAWTLTDKAKEILMEFSKWSEAEMPDDMGVLDWLEALASIHYINHYICINDKSQKGIVNYLLSVKQWFTEKQAIAAYNHLDSVGLIKNLQLI